MLGVYNTYIHHIVFDFCMTKKKYNEGKKKDEQIEIVIFNFFHFEKGYWNIKSRFSSRIAKGCIVNLQIFVVKIFSWVKFSRGLIFKGKSSPP